MPQRSGKWFGALHLRTSDQHKSELPLRVDAELCAMEFKLATCPAFADMARLEANAALVEAKHRFPVCQRSDLVVRGARVIFDL